MRKGYIAVQLFFVYFLALAIFSFFAASIITMQEGAMPMAAMGNSLMTHGANCPQPRDNSACVAFHLGILQNLSQALLHRAALPLILIAAAMALGLASLAMARRLLANILQTRERCRRLKEKTSTLFFDTLGFWLNLTEKKVPARVFIMTT